MNNKYPYYGTPRTNWSKVGAAKNTMVVKFTAPNTGVVVKPNLGYPKGTKKSNWSEHNFDEVEFNEKI